MPAFDVMTAVGLIAAACTTFSFLPQAMQAWRTRSTKDISLGMFSVMTFGVALWVIYGVARMDVPLIAANVITFGFAATILYLKLRHG
jgi:MtN3 and saliva related transmembrane protein